MSASLAVASVISHPPAVLSEFFAALERMGTDDPAAIFLFADDSDNPVSKRLLDDFISGRAGSFVVAPPAGPAQGEGPGQAVRSDQAVWRRAAMKDRLLETALEVGCSHILMVDSNLMLPPPLAAHLVSLQLDIVAEVSWSEHEAGAWPLPSVWLSDYYSLFGPDLAASSPNEQLAAANAFLATLRQPGTYPVGAVSGCTLVSRSAIEAGASFKAIANLSLAGDDRHFSVRAAALGLCLWVDTFYPPLRLDREADLGTALHFRSRWQIEDGSYAVGAKEANLEGSGSKGHSVRKSGLVSKGQAVSTAGSQGKGQGVNTKHTGRKRTERGPTKRYTPPAPAKPVVAGALEKPRRGNVLFSACMIVKDEEKALPGCLESLRGVVDEIVIYDTGSTDATVEIAKSAGAKVIEGYWDDDFGRARNASLEHCRGAWILWIDADEHFVCENPAELRSIMRDKLSTMDADALAVDINNLVGDGSQAGNLHRALRIFRQSTCCWYGSLHEQVDLRAGLGRRAIVLPLVGARIDHYGYMDQVLVERGKLQRNLRLAEAELATGVVRPDQEGVPHLNVGRALAALGRLEEAQVFFDEAMSLVAPGVPTRTVLMFKVQNLLGLGRLEDAVTAAKSFREVCQNKGLADYLEGVAQRRLGNPELAAALFQRVEQVNNEDGFAFSDTLVIAELAGALLECGRAAEAADQLVLLVEQKPDLVNLTAALQVFAATGKSIEALVAAMPEDRLDRIAAALILVPPSVADPMAEALFERFGPRPALLAAAIRFAPMVPVGRALEWSARLRAVGMEASCPLVAQALIEVLDPAERVRAAVTAHAAFGDQRAADIALSLAPGVAEGSLPSVLGEVNVLCPALMASFATAAAGPAALGEERGGTVENRCRIVTAALAGLGILSLSDEQVAVRA
ncbi:MAG: glycosyltransferase [Acidimicrobiales bacterium]|jgi:tetratricopeptide (TPR) repeat protein